MQAQALGLVLEVVVVDPDGEALRVQPNPATGDPAVAHGEGERRTIDDNQIRIAVQLDVEHRERVPADGQHRLALALGNPEPIGARRLGDHVLDVLEERARAGTSGLGGLRPQLGDHSRLDLLDNGLGRRVGRELGLGVRAAPDREEREDRQAGAAHGRPLTQVADSAPSAPRRAGRARREVHKEQTPGTARPRGKWRTLLVRSQTLYPIELWVRTPGV